MRILLSSVLLLPSCFGQAFGTWKVDLARGVFGDIQSKTLTLRFEAHSKGEVFTIDTVLPDGRHTSSSTILYFDGAARDFQDFRCSGKQSSRRTDNRTVEIVRTCTSGESTVYVRRFVPGEKELIFDVSEHRPGGARFKERLVLAQQTGSAAPRR